MARTRRTQDETASDEQLNEGTGEDATPTDEQLARREEARAQNQIRTTGDAGPGVFQSEPQEHYKTDAQANGGKTVKEPDLAVVGYKEGKPIREDRREIRAKESGKSPPFARYEFRLMIGGHTGQDYEQPILTETVGDRAGQPRVDRRRPSRTYTAGEKVWDNIDLAAVLNRPNSIKFKLVKDWGEKAYTDGVDPNAYKTGKRVGGRPGENVAEEEPEVPKKAELADMTVGELRQFAANEEIDLPGSHATKDELIDTIHSEMRRKSRVARSQRVAD
jgi:hypothetical protein